MIAAAEKNKCYQLPGMEINKLDDKALAAIFRSSHWLCFLGPGSGGLVQCAEFQCSLAAFHWYDLLD